MPNLRIITPDTSYALPISDLIVSLMDAFVEPGADTSQFLASVSPEAEAGYLSDARYWYRVALVDDTFAGVIALRDHKHVTHIFIAPGHQKLGIGRALWQAALEYLAQERTQAVTVNAAPDAIGFYEKLGFKYEGEPHRWLSASDGIRTQPIRLVLRAPTEE